MNDKHTAMLALAAQTLTGGCKVDLSADLPEPAALLELVERPAGQTDQPDELPLILADLERHLTSCANTLI